jgi:peptide chain release factor 2
MIDELKNRIDGLNDQLNHLQGFLGLAEKQNRINEIQEQMSQSDFWDDQDNANKLMRELKFLKSTVEPFRDSAKRLTDLGELIEISEGESDFLSQVESEIVSLEKVVDSMELQAILSGPFDNSNAILSINAGAGGTESCDWVSMLMRMYLRWADLHEADAKVIDILHGEEAGVKNVTIAIDGELVYGYLKAEKGVHRLVRISPFDANKRRHTSFASVDVIPQVEDDIEIEIKPEELRIDIYRSSGPGGQSVNTTDSAVRITHLPTGIVVACQNERSQLQNKNTAMKILRSRLYELKQQEKEAALSKEYGQKQKIEWGSQIRSYVMHPYSMVKDHRTDVETGNVVKVMDGDIDMFIEAYLKMKK